MVAIEGSICSKRRFFQQLRTSAKVSVRTRYLAFPGTYKHGQRARISPSEFGPAPYENFRPSKKNCSIIKKAYKITCLLTKWLVKHHGRKSSYSFLVKRLANQLEPLLKIRN